MKKCFKVLSCVATSLMIATASSAANVELYALDGRTISVAEEEVSLYTAEGMGWFAEKPVTMHSLDGRTLVVPADKVEAHQNVGWYLEEDLPKSDAQPEKEVVTEKEDVPVVVPKTTVAVKYIDGTVVEVPEKHVETYKMLGWVEASDIDKDQSTVTMYDEDGNAIKVPVSEVEKYEKDGWSTAKSEGKKITVFSQDGREKQILDTQYDEYTKKGWFATYEEAVYNYAMFGTGSDSKGVEELLNNKNYELAYNTVQDAIDRIENSSSDYVRELYDVRSEIMETWNAAAKSPLGFINYWFDNLDGELHIFYEYRNVSNSRINAFKLEFDICDSDGNVLKKNVGPYYVDGLQIAPCDKQRVAWKLEESDDVMSIKNLKVKEVSFTDGTKWTAEK